MAKLDWLGLGIPLALAVVACGPHPDDAAAIDESAAALGDGWAIHVGASEPTAKPSGSSFKPFALASAVVPEAVTLYGEGEQLLALEPGGIASRELRVHTGGASTCVKVWARAGSIELPIALSIVRSTDAVDPCTGALLSGGSVEVQKVSTGWAHARWVDHPKHGWYYVTYRG